MNHTPPFSSGQYDTAARSASNTKPTGVYFQNNGGMDPAYPSPSSHVDEHATLVAGVMIGTGALTIGVAPSAQLHSIGLSAVSDDSLDALALNRLATLNNGEVRAINLSFGSPIQFDLIEGDGKSHFTQFVDWSARQHDVLYAVSWINSNVNPDEFYRDITESWVL